MDDQAAEFKGYTAVVATLPSPMKAEAHQALFQWHMATMAREIAATKCQTKEEQNVRNGPKLSGVPSEINIHGSDCSSSGASI